MRTTTAAQHQHRPAVWAVVLSALCLKGAVIAGMLACGMPEPKTYCIRRSAVVPVTAPSLRPARQASGIVEAGVGNDTVLWAKPPKKLEGRNVGLYVPRDQVAGYLLFSPHRAVSMGASWETGIGRGAVPISKGLIDPPESTLGGGGFHFSLHLKLNRMVTLDLGCDLWGYGIPSRIAYIQASRCDNLPDPGTWDRMTKNTTMFIWRTQVAFGLALGWSHLTIAFGARNQPHNVDQSKEVHYYADDIEPRLDDTVYPYLHVGWEIHIRKWVHVTVGAYQPLRFDPIIYAPILGVGLRLNQVFYHRWFTRKADRAKPVRAQTPSPPTFSPPHGQPPTLEELPFGP